MLNLLKWNSMDFFRRYGWMFLIAVVSIIIAAVVPNGEGFTNGLLIVSSAMLGGVFFPALIVLAMYQCFSWLRHDSALLELSLPVSAWKQMLSRLIIATVVNALACLGMMVLMMLFGKYSTGAVQPLTLDHWQSIAGLTLFLVLGDMTVLISYMLTRSMGLTRLWAALFTTLLCTILMMIIIAFVVYVMIWTNMIIMPTFSMNHVISLDGDIEIISYLPVILCGLWVILLEYLGSSLLLKYSYQLD